MSEATPSGDSERTNLAPILAPVITLFIGFGAGVVFSEFIPLGKTPVIQAAPGSSDGTGSRDRTDSRTPAMDDATRETLENAAEEGDESANQILDDAATTDSDG